MNRIKICVPNTIKLPDNSSNEVLLFASNDLFDLYGKPICELISVDENIIFYGLASYFAGPNPIHRDERHASINERILILNFLNKIYNEGQNI